MIAPARGNGLSTPRINRLLRPLRNKCTALASESSSAPSIHATYSNNRAGWSKDSPPLALLQPPGNVGIRVHLDDDYMRTAELVRRLYSVRDCFKNVLQVAFGVEAEKPARRGGKDIPTLGAMCSTVIGTTIQVQFDENAAAKTEGDDDYMEEEEVMALANEIYEAVPLHYRRWTTVSQALSMILSTCPHHPTLLTVLLDVCLMWNLCHESYTLLRALLVTSISSSSASPPPISHPAHSYYLLDLCATWTGGPKCDIESCSIFTQSSFTRTLVDVLTKDNNTLDVWTCKAVTRLAREVRKTDFALFVHIAAGIAQTIGSAEGGEQTKKKWKGRETIHTAIARERLNKWVITMLNHLWVNMNLTDSELLPPSAMWSAELQAITEFLWQVQLADLHLVRAKSVTVESELLDSIVCLATCSLVSFSTLCDNNLDMRFLVGLLSEITPITLTFDELVTIILDSEDSSHPHILDWPENAMQELQRLAGILRRHLLLRLEASLWACALRSLERNSYSESRFRPDVEELKSRVIDALDEAESRCFGSVPVAPSASKPSQRRKRSDVDGEAGEGEWVWEKMVRCWIRRSPVVKRTRLDVQLPARALRSTVMIHRRSHSPVSVSPPPFTSSSTIFSSSSGGATESFTDEESHDDRKYIHRISNVTPKPVTTRRVSNFASILADAQMNRIMLHPNRSSARHKPSMGFFSTTRIRRIPIRQKHIAPDEGLVPSLDEFFSTLPSDDSLDLFAYTHSSPVAHR
ncbi:hypothetical protein PILCRDRAFT_106881 [Piloderma croceum F 1598]|uniref:Uncharacterized protein n=1 Tax=Piloderma croceum (strain F 1598) TaxID=765440 RepID=A0A0C3CQQ5_PILCF|nr:hypothetical protein PILCRDRAFT_106881 [Piloderma croceum F 1598]